MARIKWYRVDSMPQEIYNKCYSLNLRDMGQMQPTLSHWRKNHGAYAAVMVEHGHLLAWALVFPSRGYDIKFKKEVSCFMAYFYTRRLCRRSGYGARLYSAVGKRFPYFRTQSWDPISRKFFAEAKRRTTWP